MNELLRALFEPVNALLGALPMGAARVAAVALLVIPLLVVIRLPRSSVLRGAPSTSSWRDLRLWAVVAVLPYVLLYLFAR
ncbi:MAG TPA: hypothetical protein VMV46_05390 [Thermoanaerobaculia bacterium]|nr:hypothetical protein [Thermoanaerobaculia bacterium]